MKVKKIILSTIASAMVMSTFVPMSGSSLWIQSTEGSEQYNSEIENNNKNLIPAPELVDTLNDVFGEYNIKNVWLLGEQLPDWSGYEIEYSVDDSIAISFETPFENIESVIDELNSELAMYEEVAKIEKCELEGFKYTDILVTFKGENHERNIMIAEKAYSLLKNKYDVKAKNSSFANRQFTTMLLKNYVAAVDGMSEYESEDDFKERIDNVRNTVDNEMLKEEYRAVLDETGGIEFPEDITEIEKLKCYKYFVENYNARIGHEVLASDEATSLMDVDFETGDINYLNGDSNEDGELTIADATLILQSLGNADKYRISPQGEFNADIDADGISALDALEIQKVLANG